MDASFEVWYYEASIYIAERNQHMTVQFAYSDAESIKDNKYYSVSNGSYEYNYPFDVGINFNTLFGSYTLYSSVRSGLV